MFRRNFLVILIFFALVIALIFFRDMAPVRSVNVFLFRFVSPFIEWAGSARNIGGAFFSDVSESDFISLQEENTRLKALAFRAEELQKEIGDLRRALGFREESRLPVLTSRVISYRKEFGKEFLVIRAGSDDGVEEGNLAVSVDGFLLGIVDEVDTDFSKVTLASNPNHTFDIEILPSGTRAILRGLGARAFSVELIPKGTQVGRGDFISLSIRGIRLPIGTIVSVDESGSLAFQEGRATLLLDPRGIDIVSVLLNTP